MQSTRCALANVLCHLCRALVIYLFQLVWSQASLREGFLEGQGFNSNLPEQKFLIATCSNSVALALPR